MSAIINEPDHRILPGDEFIPSPGKTVTHSITIHALPEMVWPWIIQMGAGRAGWYSYDHIDNGGMPSAKKIIQELQHVETGDIIPAVPKSKDAFIVREIQLNKLLVLVVPVQSAAENHDPVTRMKGPLRVSWALILEPIDDGSSRLISRGRMSKQWLKPSPTDVIRKPQFFIERVYNALSKMPWFLLMPLAMTGHYFMERRMLRGIKLRVETCAN
ncbi:MAG TPA: hypothetical protein VJ499_02630 [Flavisolibacter sp.]|nr:hypothetical protein [Flavisolibacter sp.]